MNNYRVRAGVPDDRANDPAVGAALDAAAGTAPSGREATPFGTTDVFYEYPTEEAARAAEERIGNTGHVNFTGVETRKKS